jgi:hypothetical protein
MVAPRGGRGVRGLPRFALLAAFTLLLNTGCVVLDPLLATVSPPARAADPNAPFVVVTMGGIPVSTPTPVGVAPTIPDSTPLPRIELPTREPPTPRPAASPSLNRGGGSPAQQAARPPDASIPTPPLAVPGSP